MKGWNSSNIWEQP